LPKKEGELTKCAKREAKQTAEADTRRRERKLEWIDAMKNRVKAKKTY